MAYLGIDTVHRFTAADAKKAAGNGVSFVGRYLVPAGMNKELTQEEAANLRGAGLAILLCWEIGAGDIKGGAARGASDGSRAKALAKEFGVPECTTIFFACDYCPVQADYPAIEAYLKAAQAACSPYVAGLYGCAKIVDHIAEKGICKRFWQCVAWSEGRISKYTNVYQYQWSGGPESRAMAAKLGFSVDMNRCEDLRGAGLWMPGYASYDDGDGTILEPSKPAQKPAMWYDEPMEWADEAGLMHDGRPNDYIKRAEGAIMFQRYDQRVDQKLDDMKEELIIEIIRRMQPEDDKQLSGLLN